MKTVTGNILVALISLLIIVQLTSCANSIPPTGGPRDSLPPVLVSATPRDSTTGFNKKNITLTFDEYVNVDNPQQNLIVSPNPAVAPQVDAKLKTVSIQLKDTLEPNTTYSLNFGKSIKDVNEGNSNRNFVYVFSTGNKINDYHIRGKVILAETGKVDTTLLVVLHTNLTDSAVAKERPRYYTTQDGKGNFQFNYLPQDTFAIYVTANDYGKRYDDSTELFAFANQPVITSDTSEPELTLYAYQLKKENEKRSASVTNNKKNAKPDPLKLSSNVTGGSQDILTNLQLTFNNKLRSFDSAKIHLTDTNYLPVPGTSLSIDTGFTTITLTNKWPENTPYILVVEKDAVTDTFNQTLPKADTLAFNTQKESDYGTIHLRFNDVDLSRNPVLQFVQGDKVVDSVVLQSKEWTTKLYKPGEYELRILYDDNKNGTWDPGSFFENKRQPEIVQSIQRKLSVRANWDNEVEINLSAGPNDAVSPKNAQPNESNNADEDDQ